MKNTNKMLETAIQNFAWNDKNVILAYTPQDGQNSRTDFRGAFQSNKAFNLFLTDLIVEDVARSNYLNECRYRTLQLRKTMESAQTMADNLCQRVYDGPMPKMSIECVANCVKEYFDAESEIATIRANVKSYNDLHMTVTSQVRDTLIKNGESNTGLYRAYKKSESAFAECLRTYFKEAFDLNLTVSQIDYLIKMVSYQRTKESKRYQGQFIPWSANDFADRFIGAMIAMGISQQTITNKWIKVSVKKLKAGK